MLGTGFNQQMLISMCKYVRNHNFEFDWKKLKDFESEIFKKVNADSVKEKAIDIGLYVVQKEK